MAHSSHSRMPACYLCKPHKHKGAGRAAREPFSVLRRIGKKRRVKRGDLGDG